MVKGFIFDIKFSQIFLFVFRRQKSAPKDLDTLGPKDSFEKNTNGSNHPMLKVLGNWSFWLFLSVGKFVELSREIAQFI